MPVTKTAKRALRVSERKAKVNQIILAGLEVAVREAKKSKIEAKVLKAISLADRAAKKNVFHKNKAARMKESLSKLLLKTEKAKKTILKTKKTVKTKK